MRRALTGRVSPVYNAHHLGGDKTPDQKWFEQNYPQAKFVPPDDHWTDKHDNIEFRYYGTVLDEIVAQNVDIHFECMDTGAWWMVLHTPDGKDFHVNLGLLYRGRGFKRPLENYAFHEED